ncbi:uncharacterized protein LTHEOB_10167 [Neofusicoccum parvum]|uniref:Uncharacterized protein LTHEOB_10167 n=1 Tax=Neofusicoccum parvum TaxID=310453 RepID=A0ACB5RUD1_9PEZI|nr:uncharacterized protein LTHEOB_10167 [Neofusicoccum parvum]
MADGDQKSIGNALDSSAHSGLVTDDAAELPPRQQRSSFNPEDIELLIRKLKNLESHQQDPESDKEGLETSAEANSTYLTHGNPLDDVERTTESPIPPTQPSASPTSTDASNSNNINAGNHPTEANPTFPVSPDTPINNDINPENRPTSSNISTSNPDERNATTNSTPGPSTLPTKAYPISPACPWLGAPPSQLDLLAALPDRADRVDAVLRAHAVDPRAVAAPDRALLLALLHAADTAGRETLGFAPGRDARRGALRFVDLRDPGRGVDVRVWEFLCWLSDAVGGSASDAGGGCGAVREGGGVGEAWEGSGEGSEGSEGSRERRMRLLVETPPGSAGEGGGGGGKGARWCLLVRLLRENGLEVSDVSREQFDEWVDRPLGDDVGYFETHMRDVLRLKKIERMETEEDVDMGEREYRRQIF